VDVSPGTTGFERVVVGDTESEIVKRKRDSNRSPRVRDLEIAGRLNGKNANPVVRICKA